MLLPLFRLRFSSHVLVRLITIRKQIECWGKLYDPAQSLKRTHCGANRTIVMRHASCTLSSIASRNFSRIDGGSGGSHAALTRSAGAARNLLGTRGSVEDVIARALRLGGSGNHHTFFAA